MKRLVEPVELAKASHMRPGDPRIGLLTEVSGLKKLEKFYDAIRHLHDLDFVQAVFDRLELDIDVAEKDLEHVPRTGGVIFVANHPYGAVDGLALVHVLGRVRPDLKVMANFLLQQLEPLKDRFIGVNPFENLTTQSSYQGMRLAMEHVQQGGALAVFPAGEVSGWRTELRTVADPRWKMPVVRLTQRMNVPVVPVWFDGANGLVFQLLGIIHPNLRTLALPKQMLRMRGRSVRMRVGKPIPPGEIADFSSAEQLARYLRARTYALGSGLQVKREFFNPLRYPPEPRPIIEPVPAAQLQANIDRLDACKLSTQGPYDLYLAASHQIPDLLREIGRLREVTFRLAGEGTNKAIDLDEFDIYYDHLFLWDRDRQGIAGAYRIGDGQRIMERYGRRGFYTNTLFRMDRRMDRVLARTFELGRSFVAPDHQKQRLPLYLLWRGLLLHITSNPGYGYLLGPVSISGRYSEFSRKLIMEYVQQYHYDHVIASWVHPRNRFRVGVDKTDRAALVQAAMADMKRMDRSIAEVDPLGSGLPVLLKKYLLLNGRIIGFNRDPHFNDALDALMLLDLTRIPQETLDDLRKGMTG